MSGCFGVERRPRAGPWGWLLFSQDLLDDRVFQTQFGVELLEAAIFLFQGLEPLQLAHAHAPKLAFPTVKGEFTEAVTRQIWATVWPWSCWRKMPRIWASLKRLFFINS